MNPSAPPHVQPHPMAPFWKHTLLGSLVCAACAAPAPSTARPTTPPPRPSAAVQVDPKVEAARILRAYGESHEALDTPRRPPTPAELAAAAALVESPIPSIDAGRWEKMSAAARLNEVFEEHRHQLWLAACRAGVGRWWDRARAIDDELQARLEREPVPADFYAGLAAWNRHWAWLASRRASEPAFMVVLQLVEVGAAFRLISAQNAWAERQPPLERAVSERNVPANSWSLEDRSSEQSRFCAAADGHGPRTWPITYGLPALRPGSPVVLASPAEESGTVAQIRKQGTEWLVTRRDWTTTIELVPPCRREQCQGIDCCMVPGGCWRNVCTEKQVRQFKDHAFVLHFGSLPVAPKVGDFVDFYFDLASGHAVLDAVSSSSTQPPYFSLGVRQR